VLTLPRWPLSLLFSEQTIVDLTIDKAILLRNCQISSFKEGEKVIDLGSLLHCIKYCSFNSTVQPISKP